MVVYDDSVNDKRTIKHKSETLKFPTKGITSAACACENATINATKGKIFKGKILVFNEIVLSHHSQIWPL